MTKFSERLKTALSMRNMKQAELAQKTGISKSLISYYVSGRAEPKSSYLYHIAKALDVSEAWLIGFDVSPDRQKDVAFSGGESFELTDKEKRLIEAYRLKTEMQGAVDTLLGIE